MRESRQFEIVAEEERRNGGVSEEEADGGREGVTMEEEMEEEIDFFILWALAEDSHKIIGVQQICIIDSCLTRTSCLPSLLCLL